LLAGADDLLANVRMENIREERDCKIVGRNQGRETFVVVDTVEDNGSTVFKVVLRDHLCCFVFDGRNDGHFVALKKFRDDKIDNFFFQKNQKKSSFFSKFGDLFIPFEER